VSEQTGVLGSSVQQKAEFQMFNPLSEYLCGDVEDDGGGGV
jgi:hypothetical protein